MSNIHQTAIVDAGAEIDPSVTIGPYAVIGPHVRIGAGTVVGAHCVIEGRTTIGRDNRIFQFASLGAVPQDKKYAGEDTRLVIGDRNTIREFCTFNTGTAQDKGVTTIGDDNWIMAYVHIAHDCVIGNHTTLANNTTLAGHVQVGEPYAANLRRYLGELEQLDRWSAAQFRTVPERQRVLVTAHDAFQYLARRYGLEVRGVQGLSTVAEASGVRVHGRDRTPGTRGGGGGSTRRLGEWGPARRAGRYARSPGRSCPTG